MELYRERDYRLIGERWGVNPDAIVYAFVEGDILRVAFVEKYDALRCGDPTFKDGVWEVKTEFLNLYSMYLKM